MAFVVSTQARNAPVGKQLPIVREALVQFYLQSFVNVDGVDESIRNTVRPGVARRLAILTVGFVTHGSQQRAGMWIVYLGYKIGIASGRSVCDIASGIKRWRKNMRNRIYCGVSLTVDIPDEVSLAEETRVLRCYHGRVFNNAFQAAILIANGEHKVARQLLFKANDVFLSEAQLSSRQDWITGILRRDRSLTCSSRTRCIGNEVGRIDYRDYDAKLIEVRNAISPGINMELRNKASERKVFFGR